MSYIDCTSHLNAIREQVISEIREKVSERIDVAEAELDMVVTDKRGNGKNFPYGHRGVLQYLERPQNWDGGVCFQFEDFNVTEDDMSTDDLCLILDTLNA